MKGERPMTKESKVKLLEDRIQKLQHSGKDNAGVQRKLKRQLRSLQK